MSYIQVCFLAACRLLHLKGMSVWKCIWSVEHCLYCFLTDNQFGFSQWFRCEKSYSVWSESTRRCRCWLDCTSSVLDGLWSRTRGNVAAWRQISASSRLAGRQTKSDCCWPSQRVSIFTCYENHSSGLQWFVVDLNCCLWRCCLLPLASFPSLKLAVPVVLQFAVNRLCAAYI